MPAAFRATGIRLRGSIDPGVANAIASAIQTQEGYFPGSVAFQNNNPGNLVYAGQPGAAPGAGGFANFSSYAAGYQALVDQITLDATRGTDASGNPTTTISQLITSWAPPAENNTADYIAGVSSATGFDPDVPLSSLSALNASDDGGSVADAGVDLGQISDELTVPVDLSSVGLGSFPLWGLLTVGIFTLVLIGRR